ncbi:hypothetical protein HaLaN_18909, partial [Haematococcus lacustris]
MQDLSNLMWALATCLHTTGQLELAAPQLHTLLALLQAEFQEAAAGAGVRQLGPPPSASALLEALAPWQPRSCHLLPGALSSVATRLTQLTCLNLPSSPVALVELQLLAAMAKQVARVAVLQDEAFTCPQLATLLWALSVMRVVDRQLVERVAELLLQGPLAGTGLGAGGRPGRGVGRVVQATQCQLHLGAAGLGICPHPPTPPPALSSTCPVQLLWALPSHEHCQSALLRAAAPVLSARILQGQLSSRRVACVAWAYARLQQLEPRLVSAILRHSMAHAEQSASSSCSAPPQLLGLWLRLSGPAGCSSGAGGTQQPQQPGLVQGKDPGGWSAKEMKHLTINVGKTK